jgi:hypothetical protein
MFTTNVTSDIFEKHIDDYIAHHQIIETTTEELSKYTFFDSGGVSESIVPIRLDDDKSHNGIKEHEGLQPQEESREPYPRYLCILGITMKVNSTTEITIRIVIIIIFLTERIRQLSRIIVQSQSEV